MDPHTYPHARGANQDALYDSLKLHIDNPTRSPVGGRKCGAFSGPIIVERYGNSFGPPPALASQSAAKIASQAHLLVRIPIHPNFKARHPSFRGRPTVRETSQIPTPGEAVPTADFF